MNRKQGLARSAGVRSAVLLCCSALVPSAGALDNGDPNLVLHINGGSVSADIRAEPLVEVARTLKLKTGATIHFLAPQVKDQVITAQFKNLALEAALRAILKYTNYNYAMVARPTEQSIDIQYMFTLISQKAPQITAPWPAKNNVVGQAPDLAPQSAETQPQDPMEEVPPTPPDVFDPDPAVRLQKLEDAVATYGPQSLVLVLAAAQDLDPLVRSASEQLLLKNLRNVVPQETLSKIALTSQRADIRLQALEALAEHQDQSDYVRMTLDSALRDLDPGVQQRAKELLLKLSKSGTDSTQ